MQVETSDDNATSLPYLIRTEILLASKCKWSHLSFDPSNCLFNPSFIHSSVCIPVRSSAPSSICQFIHLFVYAFPLFSRFSNLSAEIKGALLFPHVPFLSQHAESMSCKIRLSSCFSTTKTFHVSADSWKEY